MSISNQKEQRPIDEAVKESYSWLGKSYVFIKKTKIKTWQSIFVLAFLTGVSVALTWSMSSGVHPYSSAASNDNSGKSAIKQEIDCEISKSGIVENQILVDKNCVLASTSQKYLNKCKTFTELVNHFEDYYSTNCVDMDINIRASANYNVHSSVPNELFVNVAFSLEDNPSNDEKTYRLYRKIGDGPWLERDTYSTGYGVSLSDYTANAIGETYSYYVTIEGRLLPSKTIDFTLDWDKVACFDTDKDVDHMMGLNFFVKGTQNGQVDSCIDSNMLWERFCGNQNQTANYYFYCPSACEDGRCVEGIAIDFWSSHESGTFPYTPPSPDMEILAFYVKAVKGDGSLITSNSADRYWLRMMIKGEADDMYDDFGSMSYDSVEEYWRKANMATLRPGTYDVKIRIERPWGTVIEEEVYQYTMIE